MEKLETEVLEENSSNQSSAGPGTNPVPSRPGTGWDEKSSSLSGTGYDRLWNGTGRDKINSILRPANTLKNFGRLKNRPKRLSNVQKPK
jgi:hypothetical protein